MVKYYEGKTGIGQLILCLIALATLFIPFVFEPDIIFAFNKILPIGNESEVSTTLIQYSTALFEAINVYDKLPQEIFGVLSYVIYIAYGIFIFDLLTTLIVMIARNEILRQIFRAISIFLGFCMILVSVALIPAIAGFFTYFMHGGFGDALIFDCIKNEGLIFYTGLCALSIIVMIKHFSSFFGMSH